MPNSYGELAYMLTRQWKYYILEFGIIALALIIGFHLGNNNIYVIQLYLPYPIFDPNKERLAIQQLLNNTQAISPITQSSLRQPPQISHPAISFEELEQDSFEDLQSF